MPFIPNSSPICIQSPPLHIVAAPQQVSEIVKPFKDYVEKGIPSSADAALGYYAHFPLGEELSKFLSSPIKKIKVYAEDASRTQRYAKAIAALSTIKENVKLVSKFKELLDQQYKAFLNNGELLPEKKIIKRFQNDILEIKDFKRALADVPQEQLAFFISSLSIKSSFSKDDINELIRENEDIKKTLEELSQDNNFTNIWIWIKNFWLTSEERSKIKNNLDKATNLVNSILDTTHKLNTSNSDQLTKDHLILCCELAKSIAERKQLAVLNTVSPLPKSRIIEILKSTTLDKCLVSAPVFASSVLSCLIYVGILIFSAAETALLATITSIVAIILRVCASFVVYLYNHREKQKTQPFQRIQEEVVNKLHVSLQKVYVDELGAMRRDFAQLKQTSEKERQNQEERLKRLEKKVLLNKSKCKIFEKKCKILGKQSLKFKLKRTKPKLGANVAIPAYQKNPCITLTV